ncbi:unnamed protein product, partial [Dicrocoelium dendriticum]
MITAFHSQIRLSLPDQSSCSKTFTNSESGVIQSPGYPYDFDINLLCNYAVTVAPGSQISLTFYEVE